MLLPHPYRKTFPANHCADCIQCSFILHGANIPQDKFNIVQQAFKSPCDVNKDRCLACNACKQEFIINNKQLKQKITSL